MMSAFNQPTSRGTHALAMQNTVLTSRRTRMVANDLLANVELRKMKADKVMRDVLVPPADARVAAFKTWYAGASAPEFERMNADKFAMHSLATRTEMLLGDALREVGARSTDAAHCTRRLPARYNKDVAFKMYEAVLRNIEALQEDMDVLDTRISDSRTTSMQLRIDMNAIVQPYTVSTQELPLAIHNPWPAGPAFIVVRDVMEFAELQALVARYTKRITEARQDLDPTLATWNALHKTMDVLLTTSPKPQA